jgi:hypothetical protein
VHRAAVDADQKRAGAGGHNERMFFKPRRLRLFDMLRRRGAVLPQAPDSDARAAVQRCEACNAKAPCDEYLAAQNPAAGRSFCPNAHYIECLREARLKF